MGRRIVQIGSALAAGNVVYLLAQLLLPPAFIAAYGVNGYGEWLALSAGVSWIQALDCGLHSYIVNELSIQFQRGNSDRVRQLQSVALRMSIALLGVGLVVVSCIVSLAPINHFLSLEMSRTVASTIVVLLAAEILLGILWGQLNGMIRSFGYPQRAELWSQVYRLITVVITFALVLGRAPLWLIPAVRLATFFAMTAVSLGDLRRLTPEAFPSLSYWDKTIAKEIVRPSLWFGTFTLNQFLLFQAPLLVLNYVAGKSAVVAFSVCRSFFGVVRQLAQLARASVAPELTRLAGINDVKRLGSLFSIYEGISFTVGLVGPTLAFVLAPKVVPIWIRGTDAISIPLFAVMMAVSVINVGKDTRLALLQATNTHIRAAQFCLITYGAFAIGCIPSGYRWGPTGIAVLWVAVEIVQLWFVHVENRKVLPALNYWRLVALGASALLFIPPAAAIGKSLVDSGWLITGLITIAIGTLLTLPAASVFGLGVIFSRKAAVPRVVSVGM